MVRRSLLTGLFDELRKITFKLEDLENKVLQKQLAPKVVSEKLNVLALPDHLRETLFAVFAEGVCNAEQVSSRTGRCRANESNYLNQLAREGWLTKKREGKEILFFQTKTFVQEVT